MTLSLGPICEQPLKFLMLYSIVDRGLPGVVDGGCLLLVIGVSGVNQGGLGGPGTLPIGQAWSGDHFFI